MNILISLGYLYLEMFDKVLFYLFPFAENFDIVGRFAFCFLLIIALEFLAYIFQEIAHKF